MNITVTFSKTKTITVGEKISLNVSRCQQQGNVSRGLTTLDGGSINRPVSAQPLNSGF